MQSWQWYCNRMRSMSPAEIGWRLSNAVRDRLDRVLLARHQRRVVDRATSLVGLNWGDADYQPCNRLPAHPGDAFPAEWAESLVREADAILAHRIRLFGTEPTDVGTPIRWNYEHQKQAATPTDFIGQVDYRDYAEVGDCKWVWELSRHHHLVVLGRAYALTGDKRYAAEVVAQIKSWMAASPYGTGMNWRSPLELGIRLINWAWALDLIKNADVLDGETTGAIAAVAEAHIWEVARKYSKHSSANNHLIGEAAGVYIGAAFFSHTPRAEQYRAEAKRLLIVEMDEQVDTDGIHKELALGYHLFVLQFFLLAWHAGHISGDPFPIAYSNKLLKMADFIDTWLAAGAEGVEFGDADDGYVLDLGGARGDAAGWVAATRALLAKDVGNAALEREQCYWLTGLRSQDRNNEPPEANRSTLASVHFKEAGLCLLQARVGSSAKPVSVTFDTGPLGYKSIAAHGHADALSVTLRYNGAAFLVDPGTYDYFTYDQWRNYFRSTQAHNTAEIDGRDQSEMLGKFLWGDRANAQLVDWRITDDASMAIAEHDGYQRLTDPLTHRRQLELNNQTGELVISDTFECNDSHNVVLRFHCAPDCRIESFSKDDRTLHIVRPEGTLRLSLPDHADIAVSCGKTDPIAGWFSPAYHQKRPASVVSAAFKIYGTQTVRTLVQIWEP